MKAAFDRLPLFIVERFNRLVDAIKGESDDSITEYIPTGITEGHTLNDMLCDIKNGGFASYLDVYGETLLEKIERIEREISTLKSDLFGGYYTADFPVYDCGSPAQRMEELNEE